MPDTKKVQTPSPNKKTTESGTDCMKPLSVVSKSQNASHHDKTIKGTHRTNRHKTEATMFPLSLMLYIQSRMTLELTNSPVSLFPQTNSLRS